MKVNKMITVNIGNYQTVRVGVESAPSFAAADAVLIREIRRLKLPVDQKVKQCLLWEKPEERDVHD
jgi:hypothetical protein